MTPVAPQVRTRADWDSWALGIAYAIGPGPTGRADCTRRRVGAVIIEPLRHWITGAGYNGTEPGGPSCLKGECPRGRHFRVEEPYERHCPGCGSDGASFCSECVYFFKCACGKEWQPGTGCEDSVMPGASYDTGPGACINGHAEQNAQAAATSSLAGATMYVTDEPCGGCVRQIRVTTEIAAIVWPGGRIEFRRRPEARAA